MKSGAIPSVWLGRGWKTEEKYLRKWYNEQFINNTADAKKNLPRVQPKQAKKKHFTNITFLQN